MKRTPSLIRMVQVDYLAQIGVIFPLVAWGFFALMALFSKGDSIFFRDLALVGTLVGLAVVAWRCRLITSTYEEGSQAEGTVSNVGFFRDRGRVYYVYTVQGEKLMGSNAISRGKYTRDLKTGQPVRVTYHPQQPKRAFIDELYL